MKDFDFTKSMKIVQTGSLATCAPLARRQRNANPYDVIFKTVSAQDYSEEMLIHIIGVQTVFYISGMLENEENIKKICVMLDRGDAGLQGVLENRPIVKAIVEHARNEFLTGILTREVKVE
jgi:hypothetical protein